MTLPLSHRYRAMALLLGLLGARWSPALVARAQTVPLADVGGSGSLVNLSTRCQVGGDDNSAMIAGFMVRGGSVRVVVRAIGPDLTRRGLSGAIANPRVSLYRDNEMIDENDDWRSANGAADIATILMAPPDDRESALIASLAPGSYTAIVRGVGGSRGIGLVELFHTGGSGRLVNLSTRCQVGTGEAVMIGGFILRGDAGRLVLRAIGPDLANRNVAGVLRDPTMELVRERTVLAANDNWGDAPEHEEILARVMAPPDRRESALISTLAPGTYSAIVRGRNSGEGVGLVEVFRVSEPDAGCAPVQDGAFESRPVSGGPPDHPPAEHPDYNLGVRGYVGVTEDRHLVDYDGETDSGAPQLPGLLPGGIPQPVEFQSTYRLYDWNWGAMARNGLVKDWPVTAVGMATQRDQPVHVPASKYDLGEGFGAVVLYASDQQITLKYTRDDNVVRGYTIHLDNVCVDPALRSLYDRLRGEGGRSLPVLRGGQAFGRARGSQIVVAVRDTGAFMDPRSRKDWWVGWR